MSTTVPQSIGVALGMAMLVCWSVHHLSPDQSISRTTARTAIKFCTGIRCPQDFSDPLTFTLAPGYIGTKFGTDIHFLLTLVIP